MYKRVVIAVDDPALAEAVLTFVLGFAAPPSAEVILLRVVRPLTPGESEASHALVLAKERERMREAERHLRGLTGDLAARGVSVRARVRCGEPSAEIVAETSESDADLVVITTRGGSGMGRRLTGSVVGAVLRQGTTPVLVLRAPPGFEVVPGEIDGRRHRKSCWRPAETNAGEGEDVMAKDPVCGMNVDESEAAASVTRDGKTYYFCSSGCKATFEREPQKFAR